MKDLQWMFVFISILMIQNVSASYEQSRRRHRSKSYATSKQSKRHEYQYKHRELNTPQPHPLEPEVDTLQCPVGCACQYAHFMDLPIARWINHMKARRPEKAAHADEETNEELINDNETAYEDDESFLSNPYIKQATCILQEDNDFAELVQSLPHDLQALILLYTGIGKNKTVTTSLLKPLNQLTTLEIRGPQDRSFRLVLDEPLSFLLYANFDSIMLLGGDTFKRPKSRVHPRDSFDYKPKIELDFYATETQSQSDIHSATYDSNGNKESNLQQAFWEEEIEILPYDVYLQEVRKSRLPSFYGWQHLEVLRIHSCQLKELHWEMFDGLDALQHLSLERNAIEVVAALALFGANNIRTLSLAHNAIQDLHYRALGGLLQLELLDFSDNKLTKLSEMSFPPFPKLERADFRNNPIRYIFPATFGVMNNTRTLLFGSRDMALELWNNEPFQWLGKLRELSLENVSMAKAEHNIFRGLNSLETLKLKGSIRRLEFDAFADQSNLRDIDLSDCCIQEISMDAFLGCKRLEIVNLARNNISYIPPGLFDDQKNLEEIYLEGNNLRTLPTNFFLQPKLKLARLNENPWKCSCDMYNWRAKITNQVRSGARTKRCITDYHTGKPLSCRKVVNYQLDHRYAPRCENFNGRSVFYVVRKNIQCGQGRVASRSVRHRLQTTGVHQREHKLLLIDDKHDLYAAKLDQRKQMNSSLHYTEAPKIKASNSKFEQRRLNWKIQREEKTRRTSARENSIEHVMLHQLRKNKKNLNSSEPSEEKEEISNEI